MGANARIDTATSLARTSLTRTSLTSAERLVAAVAVLALGFRHSLQSGVGAGTALAVLLALVWIPVAGRYRLAPTVLILGTLTAVWGWVLPDIAAPGHAVDPTIRIGNTALLIGLIAGVGVVLWARTVLTPGAIGLLYGIGALGDALAFPAPGTNAWKFEWAVPVSILSLSIVMLLRRRDARPRSLAGVVVLLLLAAVSAASDSRSYAAASVVAALLVLWQGRPLTLSRRTSTTLMVGMLAGLAASTYWLGTRLLVAGYLGADAQARTVSQIDQSGSVILGGRPELQATLALMRYHIQGYGAGTEPTPRDVAVAKTGLTSIHYNPDNGYVERYMFGGHIELHSMFGDLWANFGIAGLLLLALIAVVAIRTLATSFTHSSANPLVIYLAVWTSWNLFFSPLYSSVPTLLLALGLGLQPLVRRTDPAPAPPSPAPPSPDLPSPELPPAEPAATAPVHA